MIGNFKNPPAGHIGIPGCILAVAGCLSFVACSKEPEAAPRVADDGTAMSIPVNPPVAPVPPDSLDRSQAREILQKSPMFEAWAPEVTISFDKAVKYSNALEAGAKSGLWVLYDDLLDKRIQAPGPAGRAVLERVSSSGLLKSNISISLVPKFQKQVAEISGILGGGRDGGTREVQFTFHFVNVPAVFKQSGVDLPAAPRAGMAVFRLFDDGWRVERVREEG